MKNTLQLHDSAHTAVAHCETDDGFLKIAVFDVTSGQATGIPALVKCYYENFMRYHRKAASAH